MDPTEARTLSLRKRVFLTLFIIFHFVCVLGWVLPGVPAVQRILLAPRLPMPVLQTEMEPRGTRWAIDTVPILTAYLQKTGQWQHWLLFAPNPMPYHRHLAARVLTRGGAVREVTLPRIEQLGVVGAHLGARFREYQYALTGEDAAQQDLARWVARELSDPADPVERVAVYGVQMVVPPHDRPENLAIPRPWVDYAAILRDPARFTRFQMLEYVVKPGDLK